MKFSVCLIAKNEEKTLPRLIPSLKGVDEIILCDTGSTDRTIEVAKSLGVKVFENKFDIIIDKKLKKQIDKLVGEGEVKVGDTAFNFAEARNWIVTKAKNNYIFMPDCDEVVEWDLKEVEKLLDGDIDILKYNFIFSFDKYGNPLLSFYHAKFYDKAKYHWVRNIHEVLSPIDATQKGLKETVTDKILLKHYQNVETNRTQYLKGLAIDYIQNEYNDRNCHYFARELFYKGKYEKAIKMFQEHLDNPGWETEKGQSLIFMGHCYIYLKERDKAMECYSRAFTKDMNRREPLLAMADVLYREKKWTEASRLYRMTLSIPKGNYYSNISTNYGHYPWGQLSVCLYYMGRKQESFDCLKKALEYDPDNKVYKNNLKFCKEFRTEIPKIIHQIWVGPKPMPTDLMKTWKEKHPDWEFILWDNERVASYNFKNRKHIDSCIERGLYHGAADLIRYEALYDFGGFVAPADSECINNIDELTNILEDCFACYENERVRKGLVSPHLASTKGNKLIGELIRRTVGREKEIKTPWIETGNQLLTDTINDFQYPIKIYPSHYFLPEHYTGDNYQGNDKIYAKHKWFTTREQGN
jgi:glycosyltransferase involved in cell wall biosynthesis